MNSFQNKLLKAYSLSIDDYNELTKTLTYNDLEDPFRFLNIEKAVERIKSAIKNNEKTMIYGDYDCDGFTSTSIIYKMFQILNYQVGYYIPSRYKDGYGLNLKMADMIIARGYKLVILVDNGISLKEEVDYLNEHGIDVLIFDHHELGEVLPNAYAIVHPFLKVDGSNLPQCAAYVCFNISRLVLGYIDPYLLVLASLGTVSDMMSLKSYNRIIVRLGIETIKINNYPQIKYLLDGKSLVDENDISFVIAPKINSLGRMVESVKVNDGVKFLTSENEFEISSLYRFIRENNMLRKKLTSEIISSLSLDEYLSDAVYCIYVPHIKEGLIGIIANKIMLEKKIPTICFTDGEEGILKGSARSLEGLPLSEVFTKLNKYLLSSGGHALSGGLSIKKEDFLIFKEEINNLARGRILTPQEEINIEVTAEELTNDNYLFLNTLKPFGQDYKEPNFIVNCSTSLLNSLNGTHVRGRINKCCTFIGFNMVPNYTYKCAILKGKLTLDTFSRNNAIQLKISEINYKN